jgi:hypothetical protein
MAIMMKLHRLLQADATALGTGTTTEQSLGLSLCSKSLVRDSSTQHLTLHILQPLANPSMLAACLGASSDTGHKARNSNPKMLDLDVLDKAWRKTVSCLEPPSSITFDLSLPKSEDSSAEVSKVYWATSPPSFGGQQTAQMPISPEGQQQMNVQAVPMEAPRPLEENECIIVVEGRNVMRLINTIAVAARMRRPGKEVRFGIRYDEGDRISPKMVRLLKDQLGSA